MAADAVLYTPAEDQLVEVIREIESDLRRLAPPDALEAGRLVAKITRQMVMHFGGVQ